MSDPELPPFYCLLFLKCLQTSAISRTFHYLQISSELLGNFPWILCSSYFSFIFWAIICIICFVSLWKYSLKFLILWSTVQFLWWWCALRICTSGSSFLSKNSINFIISSIWVPYFCNSLPSPSRLGIKIDQCYVLGEAGHGWLISSLHFSPVTVFLLDANI